MSGVFSLDGHFSDPWRIRLSQEVKQMERKRFARLSQRLGALLLAGLYALFGDVVMPTLNERITNMFNYAGALE